MVSGQRGRGSGGSEALEVSVAVEATAVWSRLYQYLDIRERGYVSSFNVVQACNGSRNRSNPRQRALGHVVGLHGHWVSRRRRVGLHFLYMYSQRLTFLIFNASRVTSQHL